MIGRLQTTGELFAIQNILIPTKLAAEGEAVILTENGKTGFNKC